MTLENLRHALLDTIAAMSDLNNKTTTDKGEVRAFSPEEQSEYSQLEAKAASIRDAISRAETLKGISDEAKRLGSTATPEPRIEVLREDGCNEQGQYRGFKYFGEQLISVARAAQPGARIDEKLLKIRAASGINEATPSEGGFLVQSDFMVDLQRDTYDSGSLSSLCRRVTVGPNSNALEYVTIDETSRADGSRFGGVRAYWRAEAATVSANKPKLKISRLNLEDMMALCYVTDQALQDASALGSLVREAYAEEMAFVLDSAILEGDGAGKPQGIKNSGALVTVAKETSQAADTVVWQNVSKMRQSMTKRGRKTAVWIINDELLSQLEAMYVPLGSSNGLPVYVPAGQFGLKEETLYGRPIIEAEACSALGDVGDIFFADLSEYILIEKGTIDAQTSIHVRFEYGEQAFRFTKRCNGQSRVSSAITPYKAAAGAKRSPFVALAARA